MCGRFTLISDLKAICERFECLQEQFQWIPRYNIAPGQPILTVMHEHRLEQMLWGLIPNWSKTQKPEIQLINARKESLLTKPYMKSLYQHQRCLVPSDGFFEWRKEGPKKIPVRITLKNREMFAFAGLWDTWKGEDGQLIKSVTIITTEANDLLKPIHDRMPVILRPEHEAMWLNPKLEDEKQLYSFLETPTSSQLTYYEVNPLVNSWKNDIPVCIDPV